MPTPLGNRSACGRDAYFAATRWSIVLAAGQSRGSTKTQRALEELIQTYWFPLYAYVRRQGQSPAHAEDLVQGFLTRLLEKQDLASVDRERGKFRSFLLASLKNFMANEHDKATALKRGGGGILSLDSMDAEARYSVEPAHEITPDRLFDRRWALAVLDQVLTRLQQEYADSGKSALFAKIKDCLTPHRDGLSYAQLADGLDMTEGALKVAVHRMRKRYRDILHDEIAQTVDSPEQVKDEIDYLLNCL